MNPPPSTDATIYRVVWAPGSDHLLGICHCGAEHDAEDPVQVWEWLLAHPDHDPSGEQ
jgi:hypothetical protein